MDYDEDTAEIRPFSIKRLESGAWVIPSHSDYPADAREHLAAAATSLIDLESLNMVSDKPGEQETYGVIDPDLKTLKAGTTGVGTRVTMTDGQGKVLADLIIGKKVKEQPDLHYVRLAGHDQIYVAKVDSEKLSTRFGDWIEKDLLKLQPFDVRELTLNDYSLTEQLSPEGIALGEVRRSKMQLDYDDVKSQWRLEDFVEYKKGSPVSSKLTDNEELNVEKLNNLRNALGDLKIVDVQPKPKGLSRDLRVGQELIKDQEAQQSLIRRGFYPLREENGDMQIYSSEGEVLCRVKDGVQYVLRFGRTAADTEDDKKDKEKEEPKRKSKKPHPNRYLLVSCVFDEDQIPKPELQEVPAAATSGEANPPAEGAAADTSPDKASPAETPAAPADTKSQPGDPKTPAGKGALRSDASLFHLTAGPPNATKPTAPTAPAAAPAAPGNAPAATAAPAVKTPATQPPAAQAPATQPAPAATAAADAATAPQPAAPSDDKSTGATPDAATDADDAGGKIRAKAREAKALADQRANIERENKRKLDEYNSKITKGREHVKELNDRFADWYYVISDEVYHKIHLSRADVVKKKEKAAGKGDGVQDFKALEHGLPGADGHDHDHDHEHME